MCWQWKQVAGAAAQQDKPDRVHTNQMTGVGDRAFIDSSGTISEQWDDSEPEIQPVILPTESPRQPQLESFIQAFR